MRLRLSAVSIAALLASTLVVHAAYPAPADRTRAADEHLQAIVAAARARDIQGIQKAVAAYVQAIQDVVNGIRAGAGPLNGSPPGLTIAAQRVQEATGRHLRVLRALLSRVPEQAKPAIERAIEAASHGRDVALEALGGAGSGPPQPGSGQPGSGPQGGGKGRGRGGSR